MTTGLAIWHFLRVTEKKITRAKQLEHPAVGPVTKDKATLNTTLSACLPFWSGAGMQPAICRFESSVIAEFTRAIRMLKLRI